MAAKLINGKILAEQHMEILRAQVLLHIKEKNRAPALAVILVGNDPASHIYVNNKRRACENIGIRSIYLPLPETVSEVELIQVIQTLNQDAKIDGILLQVPLPKHIETDKVLACIIPSKDVDGFHPLNMGLLALGKPHLRPCTPFGIIKMLESIPVSLRGKHAVIVGASNIVGKPLFFELLMKGITVTLCHRATIDISAHIAKADIVISAAGSVHLIRGEWIKEHAIVIDVGMNRLPDGSLTGDVEFEAARQRAAWITPVPGGVGPMTVCMLLQNTLLATQPEPHPIAALS